MSPLLTLSRVIDRFSEFVGRWLGWLVLAAVLISAANAIVRKAFNTSSNAYLEIQWYLFAAVFLLAAGYTMLRQGHVKIDVVSGRFSKRTQIWIDVIGLVFFVFPLVFTVIQLSWPLVVRAYVMNEYSSNAGGLIRWPVKLVLVAGFALLSLQGVSELIKRVAAVTGHISIDTKYEKPLQ